MGSSRQFAMSSSYTSSSRRIALGIVFALLACSLGGCGSISSFLAGSMGDYIPAWAGGLPADAPPRPGTAKYDEWIKQQGRRAEPAAKTDADRSSPTSADAIH